MPTQRPFYPERTPMLSESSQNLATEHPVQTETSQAYDQRIQEQPPPLQTPIAPSINLLPETTLRLPNAIRFDGSPTNYQAFISNMNLYFWARPEVFNEERNRIVHPVHSDAFYSLLLFPEATLVFVVVSKCFINFAITFNPSTFHVELGSPIGLIYNLISMPMPMFVFTLAEWASSGFKSVSFIALGGITGSVPAGLSGSADELWFR
ncbi:hypothetical protein BB561_000655 [Smittium simulii]|uniref:Uncharacterized protein n=1 Tax=Smittium simulii TaxID=133385 RepID=A0A2T9YY16_9FUNG|nr:hypothetical protein BB561_000655 [Smittium simulii]